ncbi:orotate phosphoribosyltransferase [Lacticaseibacillus yichunensis]|uniref:Orotate phosphoribosyltransferase n=1 Tax=Lacticaseibacillus yichunensis TaxID=2486015 RepID=A0ABW4CSK9_9LACO|nr:orotate phosphoribosyltransferase [Lacticaseibacillus yichunensis]
MEELETTIAQDLLKINAVTLRPNDPFTWASGIISPIYTDNRLTISYPAVRTAIADGLAALIKAKFPDVEVIGGVATAGIPHASLVAERLGLPLIYVRSKPKDHGQGRQIEGALQPGAKVVLIDDLLSTGGSVLKAAEAATKDGANVIGVAAIFSYQLPAAETNFAAAGIPFATLTTYTALIHTAEAQGTITASERDLLATWREDPTAWGK